MYRGYKMFKEKSQGRVPLEGMQANQMLRVRPTANGTLEVTRGDEPWSFSVAPGRCIPPKLANARDAAVAEWPDNVPPVPEWSWLDGRVFHQDDAEEEPHANEPVFDFAFDALELTAHQKEMLKPPHERIAEIKFPETISKRVTVQRKYRRRSKWAAKFQGVNTGQCSRKWAQS